MVIIQGRQATCQCAILPCPARLPETHRLYATVSLGWRTPWPGGKKEGSDYGKGHRWGRGGGREFVVVIF